MAPVGGKPKHPGKAIIAGGVSGAIEICCTYPIEFTKTVAQLDSGSGGTLGVIKNTMKTSGPLGFYRGLSSMVYFATPKAAIRFSAFEKCSGLLTGSDGKPMLGGATAFPRHHDRALTLRPATGDAVFFAYKENARESLHAGCPVREGAKRVVSIFLRDGVTASSPASHFDVDGGAAVGVNVAGEIGV